MSKLQGSKLRIDGVASTAVPAPHGRPAGRNRPDVACRNSDGPVRDAFPALLLRPHDDSEDGPERRSLDLGLIGWVFSYTRPYAVRRNVLLGMVVLRSIQLPLLAWGIGQIIDGPIAHRSARGVLWGTLAYLAFSAFTQLVLHFRVRLSLNLGEAVVHDMRDDVFTHLQRMPMRFFNVTKLGRIISRMTSDAEAVRVGVQDVLFVGLVALGQMTVAAVLMAYYDRTLFAIVAAMVPGLWLANRHFHRKLSVAYRAVQESFSRITSAVAESIQGIQVTQGLGRQAANALRFRDLVADHGEYNLEAARSAGRFLPLLEFNNQFFLAALLIVGGYRVLTPGCAMPLGDLIRFLFLANFLFGPIQSLGDQCNQALAAMAGAERVRRLLSETHPPMDDASQQLTVVRSPDASDAARSERPGPARRVALTGHVRFERVSFGYLPQRTVLDEIDFEVQPGQTAALVGHTGSGKTSIINLLAKFYSPSAGRILLDGREIRQIDAPWLHRQMGIVAQQSFLFSGTVSENIRFSRPEASDEEVRETVARLGCLDLFDALPDRLHTQVGESGSRLSLGQRQLVCFARALLADPRILLLDEATSSIDVFTEYRIQQALATLLRGRTSFVVAHRLSTICNADLVLVLEQGRIVQRGTHAQLVARAGTYARLHRKSRVADSRIVVAEASVS